jgi:glyceraldehyde-3-phosphate dehydrogenase (NAD(P))
VIPGLDVVTLALVAAHTTSHLHAWNVELTRPIWSNHIAAFEDKDPFVNIA